MGKEICAECGYDAEYEDEREMYKRPSGLIFCEECMETELEDIKGDYQSKNFKLIEGSS